MSSYGFAMDTVVFMYSYLKRRKQNVKMNNIESLLKIFFSGVLQGSTLDLIKSLLIYDSFLFIKANLAKFADGNIISAASKVLQFGRGH